jgi:glycosidase
VQDAVFYQIFPDRFFNGDPANDPPNLDPWGAKPTLWGFQGGDLRGVIAKLDYLLDLGINAIYFNPIFQASSNHRYNISDYYKIDPKLGNVDDFRALLDAAHQNGIRIVIDGVFNHCGRGFFAFNDILENGSHSPYLDWFHLNNVPPDAYSPGDADDYQAWWNFKSLPKFNTDNPQVRKYILDIARYWIGLGADGWRLDVPNEIDDPVFWEEFRATVKSENPDAYLVGEIWDGDPDWVGPGKFDGLMNYPVREGLIEFLLEKKTADDFSSIIDRQLNQYAQENVSAMYNLLGSHDTKRIKTILKGNQQKLFMAYLFHFAFPGSPAIYYGDEVGLEGGKDPDCRKAFPWDDKEWDRDLRQLIQQLIAIRKNNPALRRGSYQEVLKDPEQGLYGFIRVLGRESLLVILNASGSRQQISLDVGDLKWPAGKIVRDLIGGAEMAVSESRLEVTLEPWTGVWMA